MKVASKIYYDNRTGDVLIRTGERAEGVRETTVQEDLEFYNELRAVNSNYISMIKLNYGQYSQDFIECTSYKIDLVSKKPNFTYPIPGQPGETITPKVPLSEEVENLRAENESIKYEQTQLSLDFQGLYEYLTYMGVVE